MADTSDSPAPGLRRLTELDAAWRVDNPAERLRAIRRAVPALRDRIKGSGAAIAVRTADIATFPYPTAFGLANAARSLALVMTSAVSLLGARAAAARCSGSAAEISTLA